jgi:glycosidase
MVAYQDDSVLSFYKNMIKARKDHFKEIYDFDFISSDDLLIFSKGSSEKIICIFNLDNETKSLKKNNYQYNSAFPSNKFSIEKDYFIFQPYGFGFFNLR